MNVGEQESCETSANVEPKEEPKSPQEAPVEATEAHTEQNPTNEPEVSSESSSGDEQTKESVEPAGKPAAEEASEAPEASQSEASQSEETPEEDASTPKQPAVPLEYAEFQKLYEALPAPEQKLGATLEYMEGCLSQQGSPHFRDFWEARKLCIPLFRESIAPGIRSELWAKYTHLSKEAKALKEVLDEQSQFAVEQIDMAITALEAEINGLSAAVEKGVVDVLPDMPQHLLQHNADSFRAIQSELNLMNACATRINSLRKELIRTEMRIRFKNKFFQRLSKAGDAIFPRRKELIKQVSDLFQQDVDGFVNAHFKGERPMGRLFEMRENIKALQALAKSLTLNTQVFTSTRKQLSTCWDRIRDVEKDKRKERNAKKAVFKENQDKVQEKINEFAEAYTDEMSLADADQHSKDIQTFMREVELGREEVQALKDEIKRVCAPLDARKKEAEEERKRLEEERAKERQQKIEEFQQRVEALLNSDDSVDAENLQTGRDELVKDLRESSIPKSHKLELERSLKGVKDLILDRREKALLSLSSDDREALENLKQLLEQRKQHRREIKDQLEQYRRTQGGSGLDFEKAMEMTTLVAEEKENLEKADRGIREIEEKLKQLSGGA